MARKNRDEGPGTRKTVELADIHRLRVIVLDTPGTFTGWRTREAGLLFDEILGDYEPPVEEEPTEEPEGETVDSVDSVDSVGVVTGDEAVNA